MRRKLAEKGARYGSLADVHDMLGLRVITYFPDEVDAVAKVVEQEFNIDWENSVDKRALLDPDRFGYLSLHYVVRLSAERARLPEHASFRAVRFEIQVRSILQHAWAEIEHDLGYHNSGAVPRTVRRGFSRLAGLLEIADDEFQRLRTTVEAYQSTVDAKITSAPDTIALDRDSIAALIRSNSVIAEFDDFIVDSLGAVLLEPFDDEVGEYPDELRGVGFETVDEVAGALAARRDLIQRFAWNWVSQPLGDAPKGLALFYLAYVMLGERGDVEEARRWLDAHSIGDRRGALATRVIETYRSAIKG
jgi:ppGpp synthetase/RelA/SpoT-type nucleotidyltranferase